MSLEIVILVGLSVYSSTYMFRYTDGLCNVFARLREKLGVYTLPVYDDGGEVYIGISECVDDRVISKLVSCFWCLSTWVAVVYTAIWFIFPLYIYVMAVIGVSGVIYEAVHGKSDE